MGHFAPSKDHLPKLTFQAYSKVGFFVENFRKKGR